jgi:hypothetical protein
MTWIALRVTPPLTAVELRDMLSHAAAYDDEGVRAINAWRAGRIWQRVCGKCECEACKRKRGAA